jgi:A/G-specific adenine glycosylase
MLQQTQVERVVPYYKRFIKQFPTASALAKAPLSKVLLAWQGLGYNRRAKYLQGAAKVIAKEGFSGQKLPGVGPYTRGAVFAFAYNKPELFIETNIRTVLLHHSSVLQKTRIGDSELLPLVEKALKDSKMEPREFYWAMMDYGSHLKKQGIKLNSRSIHYKKQSKFEGSRRQKSAAQLRAALKKGASERTLTKLLHS